MGCDVYDAEEGYYGDDLDNDTGYDDDDVVERFIGAHGGICTRCGNHGYLFENISIFIDDNECFIARRVCTECVKEVVDVLAVTEDEVEN